MRENVVCEMMIMNVACMNVITHNYYRFSYSSSYIYSLYLHLCIFIYIVPHSVISELMSTT